MAKQTWNNPIDKNVNWGGDSSTGNLPVSGEMVQKFIKDSLNRKAGYFYYDSSNNRYLVFADEETKNSYILDPTQTALILGTFDAPANYYAEIDLLSDAYNAVSLGSNGNNIEFTFDTKNKQGASTGENVIVTYTFVRNSARQNYTETRRSGEAVRFNIDKYLGEGTNTIMVSITGQTTLASTSVSIVYQVVNLSISDTYDISQVYYMNSGSQILSVPFTISGSGTKIIEWYIDGALLPFIKADDEVVDVVATRTKHITLSNLQQGTHNLQIRAYTRVNGELFYTDTLYREFIVYTATNDNPIISIATSIPKENGIIAPGKNVQIYDMVQYVPYILRFAVFNPSGASRTDVTITFDSEVKGIVETSNGEQNTFSLVSSTAGNKTLKLNAANAMREFHVSVDRTNTTLEEISNALALDFTAIGKSNNSEDRSTWTDGEHTATLEGFNWNNASGWIDGRLEMSAGSSITFDYAPLADKPTKDGKTIEIEWSTKNVIDDDAIICDLRDASGVGIVITATKVSMRSADGVVVETEYKSDENVRIGFVINMASGSSNSRLSFIYVNGIISRAEQWAISDNYDSPAMLRFASSSQAQVSLKSIRIYNAALSSDNMLNNYTLYRDTVEEMMEVYDRNNVYAEGSVSFAPERMESRLPVMIVTGEIPILENTSDKDTQIIVDIEYRNLQDPSKSFTMKNAAMRPQGTSSMGYPKKNFRIYTQKVEATKVYDSNNKEIEDKLYSFKEGAQPVNCWCLKADYAESSGTHNTGIARMWNDALVNVQIGGEYVCRTGAQKAAMSAGYKYDVRTTIDGFPILLFYRPTANAEPIFIGKYNFNNDKSTENVFGFKGIPNFDNSKMQCWEVLNNGNALALFTTVDGFDSGWSEAFESRYPDTSTPNTSDLKAFCRWMSSVSQSAFATEKWQHLNVYMMAAYYCYLMRHAAADQFVKNAMFTSEDGQHFYYILYDNDTINGLINTGHLRIKPTDNRNTVDETGSYVFAGHDSRLWNMLEADTEFMDLVSEMDNALYSAGISYANAVKVFDTEQADKWVEKVYNQDAQYKYIGPYVEKGIDNLFMLQGKRDLHRRWWLAKRFAIYDAKYVSGSYKSQSIEIKCLNGTAEGQRFSIKAGYPLEYGYGINDLPRQKGVALEVGESFEFATSEVVNIGDPVRIYGAPNIAEIDFSKMSDRLAVVTIANVYDENLGTKLTKLVLGSASKTNAEVSEISGLKQASALEYLDVQGMTKIISLDLSGQQYLKTLKAFGSGLSSANFANGAPLERLELPASMRVLSLEQLPYLSHKNVAFEDIKSITSINVIGCSNVSNDFSFIKNWISNKTASNASCSLIMDRVDWKEVDPNDLISLGSLGYLSLKGNIVLSSINLDQINRLIEIFGESAFAKGGELYIDAPNAVFVIGRTSILEGESETYSIISFGSEVLSTSYSIYGNTPSGVILDGNIITTTETGADRSFVLRVIVRMVDGSRYSDTQILVSKRIYPTASNTTIEGSNRVNLDIEEYRLAYPENVNGDFVTTWNLSTDQSGYLEIESFDDYSCRIKKTKESIDVVTATLTANLTKRVDGASVVTLSKNLELVNEAIAEIDAGIVAALHNAGLCASDKFITKEEAARVIEVDLQPGATEQTAIFYNYRSQIKSFEGFRHFTSLTSVPAYTLWGLSLESLILPPGIKHVYARQCNVTNLTLNEGLEEIGEYAFYIKNADELVLPSTIKNISKNNSFDLYAVKKVDASLPSELTYLCGFNFNSNVDILGTLSISSSIKQIERWQFGSPVLNKVYCYSKTAPEAVTNGVSAFCNNVYNSASGSYINVPAGRNYTGKKILYVPVGATGYNTNGWEWLTDADKGNFKISHLIEAGECLSLSIVANDVRGKDTKTTIYWTAKINGIDGMTGDVIENVTITGEADSESFPINESTTETIEREIAFTYLGVTAKTTIIQGVFVPKEYNVNLNNHWRLSTEVPNPDGAIYDGVYESFINKGVRGSMATMYIDIDGYETFRFYIRSEGDNGYCYMLVSQLDKEISSGTSYGDTNTVKAHTYYNQQYGTAISDYTLVEFTGIDKGIHRIAIVYYKFFSSVPGADRGYLLIPKDQ